ncbi:GNAT family N-acetyltransferase [Kaistia algarum]|uniref:GNAT family N-acetyltransferase n=1 Tax=Kaistia algarum TaxID=2083279 RepID=UPI000CE736A1|nr:GNAT family N-acetyltransferase [Kaistia algarum]MCX5515569.1 GNAT family N-acetyltransferase [Kaistia algarum]PPE81035.1 GNAT family N-acetyltransferase [Kaistia algarum]
MSKEFTVRTMGPNELDITLGWAKAEGWNPGWGDREPFLAADVGGFLMGFLGEEPVTAVSVVRYGESFGFLGFYICRPDQRGKGYGWRTWQAGLTRLEGRTIGLDGVVAQQANYARSGFGLAHRNIRFGGRPDLDSLRDPGIVEIGPGLFDAVSAYDRGCFPAGRTAFLRAWLDGQGGRRSLALVENGEVRGFGTIRPAVSGYKIGPLFADGENEADRLFAALAAGAERDIVFLDCPEPNATALALAARHGLTPAFETARMYRGSAPSLPLSRIFGITSFELG